jgi:hypothetical protein
MNKNTKQARKRGKTNAAQGRTLSGSGSKYQAYATRNVEDVTKGRNVDSGAEREAAGRDRWDPPKVKSAKE